MSDDLIHDAATIRASWEEPEDRAGRYWAAINRDRARQTVDAVLRLANAEQAGLRALVADIDELAAAALEDDGRNSGWAACAEIRRRARGVIAEMQP